MLSEPLLVVARIASVFDALVIQYVVGGSFASSVYGTPRATQDVDVVADIRPSHVDAITNALAGDFYVDADMIRDAIKRRAAFNVSPEDTLLHKLIWYQLGNEVSDRQWGDVLGVLRVQGEALDGEYLDRWAPLLGVAELLSRARSQRPSG